MVMLRKSRSIEALCIHITTTTPHHQLGGCGIGNVISGPISAALLEDAWSTSGKWGYSTEYGPVILFTGMTALLGGWGWIWKAWKQITI